MKASDDDRQLHGTISHLFRVLWEGDLKDAWDKLPDKRKQKLRDQMFDVLKERHSAPGKAGVE